MIFLKLLAVDEFYAQSETIEIAKGKYKLPESIKETIKLYKRKALWQVQRK
tara:strand:+ start:11460 stop:11612 length:153 start_codon:yes stop_codon:yes gene_type:complete